MDYINLPLARRFRNEPARSLITIGALCLIGFWHGASWNFILFGLFHGIAMRLWNPVARVLSKLTTNDLLRQAFGRISLAAILSLSAPMFLVTDTNTLKDVIGRMFSGGVDLSSISALPHASSFLVGAALGACLLIFEIFQGKRPDILTEVADHGWMRRVCILGLIVLVLLFGNFGQSEFVYFVF